MVDASSAQNVTPGSNTPPPGPVTRMLGHGCAWLVFAVCIILTGSLWQNLFRVMMVYRETTCTILEKDVRLPKGDPETLEAPWFRFSHELGAKRYEASGYDAFQYGSAFRSDLEAILARYSIGGRYRCWYDADSPSKAVLVRFSSPLNLVPPFLMAGITAAIAAGLLLSMVPAQARGAFSRRFLRGAVRGTESPEPVKAASASDRSFRMFLGCLGAVALAWNVLFLWLLVKSWQDWTAGYDGGTKALVAGVVLAATWIFQGYLIWDWRTRNED